MNISGSIVHSDIEEREYLLLLKKGDYGAFNVLYAHYSPRILGRLIRLLKQEDIAAELLQDLFFRVWEKRKQINVDQPFKAYLFKIAQNLVYDYFRKQSVSERYRIEFAKTYAEHYDHIEEDLEFNHTRDQLMQTIDKLPPQCKQVYTMFKLEGKSYAEISAQLGISKSTINNHLTKANTILKKDFPFLSLYITSLIFNLFN